MKNLPKKLIDEFKKKSARAKFIPGKTWIEVAQKTFDHREIQLGFNALIEGHWSQGKYVHKFEEKFSTWLGRKHCITTNSGSSALLLAITALTSPMLKNRQLKSGDEIITVAAGFPTTVNPIIQNSLTPVFVDINLDSLNIDTTQLEKARSSKTKAIVLAHTLGIPFDIQAIKSFCRQHQLFLIEDNADSLGSKYKGKYTGTFSDMSTHSFYPAHHMTMGEGGAVVTNSNVFEQILRSLRDWGRYLKKPIKKRGLLPPDYDQRYTFYELGYNLKITEMQAALGLAQLNKLKAFTKKRIQNGKFLSTKLASSKYLIIHRPNKYSQPSWFGFPITVKPRAPFTRQQLVRFLHKHKIDTRLLLAGNLTKQPYFKNLITQYKVIGKLTNTDIVMRRTFWVGCSPSLKPRALKYVTEMIKKYERQYVTKLSN